MYKYFCVINIQYNIYIAIKFEKLNKLLEWPEVSKKPFQYIYKLNWKSILSVPSKILQKLRANNIKTVATITCLSQADSRNCHILWQWPIDNNFQLLSILAKNFILDISKDLKQKSVTGLVLFKTFHNGNTLRWTDEATKVNAKSFKIKSYRPRQKVAEVAETLRSPRYFFYWHKPGRSNANKHIT